MKKWIVSFEETSTVKTLKEMGIISYIPKLYESCKFVLVETNMSEKEILKIKGVTKVTKERTFRLV